MKRNKKFIFVTGGVLSSLGKGLSAAAIELLKPEDSADQCKDGPYINVDPGTMSPYQHGEFVTEDGAEADLILAITNVLLSVQASQKSNFTTAVYKNVIERERREIVWEKQSR